MGADDVLVRIDAASVNPLDMKIRDGDLQQILPYSQGSTDRTSWCSMWMPKRRKPRSVGFLGMRRRCAGGEHPSEPFEVGQEIKAEEIGRWREGQLHLSARACEIPALRSFLLAFERGQVVTGTVSEVHNFGVFVHVDGEPEGLCTGFIRVPDLTWGWISHPSEVVEAGQRITAEVIIAETRSGQVTLSLKALQEDPLIRFADQVGRVRIGPITRIVVCSCSPLRTSWGSFTSRT
ncbi:S1 RNA-binding domain-containing protein [Streptomyces sp. NPDC060006]|uniref:S1 RNA-binding domain-containing protein n=1 Tax=unclassified Streptomyces TaxID=2593676 RepID=UPI0036772067